MKFIQRLGYYLGGFSIGLVILFFFLNGKDASCDYGPNARTIKNISQKPMQMSEAAIAFTTTENLDSTKVKQLLKFGGTVNFSESTIVENGCNVYTIENYYKEKPIVLTIENCNTIATLQHIYFSK